MYNNVVDNLKEVFKLFLFIFLHIFFMALFVVIMIAPYYFSSKDKIQMEGRKDIYYKSYFKGQVINDEIYKEREEYFKLLNVTPVFKGGILLFDNVYYDNFNYRLSNQINRNLFNVKTLCYNDFCDIEVSLKH